MYIEKRAFSALGTKCILTKSKFGNFGLYIIAIASHSSARKRRVVRRRGEGILMHISQARTDIFALI